MKIKKYKIIRMFMNHPTKTVKRGVTLEEAQRHCADPETSYKTCTKPTGLRRTKQYGPWFDGYDDDM